MKKFMFLLTTLLLITPTLLATQDTRLRCKPPKRTGLYKNAGIATDCDASGQVINSAYNPTELYEIPVVVHVIYADDGTGNLSEAKVIEMIRILNEDFRAAAGTSAANGNNVMIQFYLATSDPNGNATSGITYTQNDTWFREPEEATRAEYGSALAWDTTRYLNIFTTGMDFALGYVVYMPWESGANPSEEGISMAYDAVGTSTLPGVEGGHTITHEVGHYLGLEHTFGFDNSCPNGDCYQTGDYLCDTPAHLENDGEQGCDPIDSCGEGEPVNNYMNYRDDECLETFSNEQINRMRCTLVTWRSNLIQNRDGGGGTDDPNPTRWLPHIARIGGDFTTTLFARNSGNSSETITLVGYDSAGNLIDGASYDRSVSGNGFMSEALDSIFGNLPSLSHVGITGSGSVKVSMGYKVANGNGATAHLNEQSSGSTKWYFYPGEPAFVFDGIAALNIGSAATDITVRVREKNGTVREEETLASGVDPKEKALGILSVLFNDSEDAVIEVEASQPLLIIALRGSQGGDAAYLYESIPTSND